MIKNTLSDHDKIRKQPFRFTLHNDIRLLKIAYDEEPWTQFGPKIWTKVSNKFNGECKADTTDRIVKEHFRRLLEDFRNEDLAKSGKSGTEEDYGEREILIQIILDSMEPCLDEAREEGRVILKFKKVTKIFKLNTKKGKSDEAAQSAVLMFSDVFSNEPENNLMEIENHGPANDSECEIVHDLGTMDPSSSEEFNKTALSSTSELIKGGMGIKRPVGRPKCVKTVEKDEANSARARASEAALKDKNALADDPTHSRGKRLNASELAKELFEEKKSKNALKEKQIEDDKKLQERKLTLEENRLKLDTDRLTFEREEADRKHKLALADREEKSKLYDLLVKLVENRK